MAYRHAAIAMLGQVELGRPFQPNAFMERERMIQLASPPLGMCHVLGVGEERSPESCRAPPPAIVTVP
jgi:hypothetical protein